MKFNSRTEHSNAQADTASHPISGVTVSGTAAICLTKRIARRALQTAATALRTSSNVATICACTRAISVMALTTVAMDPMRTLLSAVSIAFTRSKLQLFLRNVDALIVSLLE